MVYVIFKDETSLPSPPLTFIKGKIFLTLLQMVYVIQGETSLPSPPLTFIKGQIFLTLLQMVYVIYKMRHPFLLPLLPL
jgi:hypothetical protein